MAMLGSGPFANSSGSGYYTVDDYRRILSRAAERHVEIIPEFDMPSHSHAAIKSMEARYRRNRNHPDGTLIAHLLCWRRGVVVSGVHRMNEVNARRARLVPGWVTVFGWVYHLGM